MTEHDFDTVMDIYHHMLVTLDGFELRRLNFRSIRIAGVSLDLMRHTGNRLIVTHVDAWAGCAGAATLMRALADFADVVGWTVHVDPADLDGLDEPGEMFLDRFGFTHQPGQPGLLRLPRPLALH